MLHAQPNKNKTDKLSLSYITIATEHKQNGCTKPVLCYMRKRTKNKTDKLSLCYITIATEHIKRIN